MDRVRPSGSQRSCRLSSCCLAGGFESDVRRPPSRGIHSLLRGPTPRSSKGFGSSHSELIAALIFGMSGMSFDDRESHLMPGQQFVEGLPEFDVLDRFPAAAFLASPAVPFPAGHPFNGPFSDIGTVGDDFDSGLFGQRPQPFNDRGEFHLIVRGQCRSAGGLALFPGLRMP